MKVRDITALIESVAPVESALDFDNVGLLVGDRDREVTRVLVALDATSDAVDKAIKIGAEMIVTHHPIIFYPMKRIVCDDVNGAIIMNAIKNDIALYASHTNFDNAKGGITDALLSDIKVIDREPLLDDGTGRLAVIRPTRLGEILDIMKRVTGDTHMRLQGDEDRLITRLAIINGAGGRDESLIDILVEKGAELFITGEVKHSFALLLKESGISLMDIEHYHAERIFNDIMATLVATSGVEVTIFNDTNPYND